jgi:hypothetical protein
MTQGDWGRNIFTTQKKQTPPNHLEPIKLL